MRLNGKTVIVTGASRGIGAASAEEFARKGATVVLAAQDEKKLSQLAKKIGSTARVHVVNIAEFKQMEKMFATTLREFVKVYIVINNAGTISPIKKLMDISIDDWNHVIDVNLKGVFYGIKLAIPSMLQNGGGTFLTLSSGAAHNPLEAWSHYCTSKAAVNMLVRCVDLEYRQIIKKTIKNVPNHLEVPDWLGEIVVDAIENVLEAAESRESAESPHRALPNFGPAESSNFLPLLTEAPGSDHP